MNLYDKRMEDSLLGAMLCDNEVVDESGVTEGDFTSNDARVVFMAIRGLVSAGERADVERVTDALKKAGAEVGLSYLIELTQIPTAANAMFYARKVRDLSLRRRLKEMAFSIMERVEMPAEDTDRIVEEIDRGITRMEAAYRERMIGDYLGEALDIIQRRYEGYAKEGRLYLDGLTTGFPSIDIKVGGMKPGSLVVVGARTSIGKTAFACNMALALAKAGKAVGFFSCEQPGAQLALRMLAGECHIDSTKLSTGQLQEADYSRMMEKGGIIKTAKITVDDTPNIQLHTLKARARAMRRKGAEAVFIDYLTLIRHNTSAPMWERVGEVSKQLKELARELDVPVVVLSQLGRQSEDKEPSLADMRQSGAVEEDADVVILLHRARETDGDEIEAKVHVAKNRHGDTGTVLLIFDRRHVRFREKDIIHGTK